MMVLSLLIKMFFLLVPLNFSIKLCKLVELLRSGQKVRARAAVAAKEKARPLTAPCKLIENLTCSLYITPEVRSLW